jgi:HK97 family phage portal protein
MGIFDRFIGQEARSFKDPTAKNSTKDFLSVMGWGDFAAAAGVTVNVDTAMGVPAIWAAVNFIGGTLAGLPLHVYRKTDAGRERVTEGFGATINTAVNDEMSSFEWRKYMFEQVLTGGRSITYIERDEGGNVRNLHPIDPNGVLVERKVTSQGFPAKTYRYNQRIFKARDIIDLTFMVKANQLDPRGPIATNMAQRRFNLAAFHRQFCKAHFKVAQRHHARQKMLQRLQPSWQKKAGQSWLCRLVTN